MFPMAVLPLKPIRHSMLPFGFPCVPKEKEQGTEDRKSGKGKGKGKGKGHGKGKGNEKETETERAKEGKDH